MKTNTFLLLLFLVIGGVFLAIYIFSIQSNKNTSTANNNDSFWITYTDAQFDFAISYPPNLQKTISTKEQTTSFGKQVKNISFHTQGPGNIGVKVYSELSFSDIKDFLKLKNDEDEHIRYEIEKEFIIETIPTTIFHTVSIGPENQEEHFLDLKYAVFIRDGKLFEVWTRFNNESDHEKVWNSLSFLAQ